MSNLPTVSVCIANYNGMEVIDDCIASVLAQDCGFPVEIIVHDDASTDGSANYIRAHYPEVHLIESAENVGFCMANNRMAAAARGEHLLLLNNDAELLPDALTCLIEEANRLRQPAILGLPQYEAESGKLLDVGSLLDPFLNPVPNLDRERGEVGMVMGACLWIPKCLWEELGGFPDWFGSIGEDLYLCCLARLWGHPVRALGTSGYRHHVGQSFGGGKVAADNRLVTTLRRRTLSERNKSIVILLCYPALLLTMLLPLHLSFLVAEGLVLSLCEGRLKLWNSIYWNCLRYLLGNISRLLRERQSLQAMRVIGTLDWLAPFTWMPYKLKMLARHGLPEVRA